MLHPTLGLSVDDFYIRGVSSYNLKNVSTDDVLNKKLDTIEEISIQDPLHDWGGLKSREDGWLEFSNTSDRHISLTTYATCNVQKTVLATLLPFPFGVPGYVRVGVRVGGTPVVNSPVGVPEMWSLIDIERAPPCKKRVGAYKLSSLSPHFSIKDGYLHDAEKSYSSSLQWQSPEH